MYFDPGFGGALFQVLVAVAAAGGILVFSLRRKLRALFSGKKNRGKENEDTHALGDSDEGIIDMLADESADEDNKIVGLDEDGADTGENNDGEGLL